MSPVATTSTTTGAAPRRRGRPRDDRVDALILEAALDLLGEAGFAGVTVDAVAARAGVGRATIYRRWPTKEALLVDAARATAAAHEDPDTGNVRDDLVGIYGGLATLLTDSPAGALLPALIAEASRNEELRDLVATVSAERRAVSVAALERAKSRGEIRADADVDLAVDALAGPFFVRALLSGAPMDGTVVEGVVDLVLAALRP